MVCKVSKAVSLFRALGGVILAGWRGIANRPASAASPGMASLPGGVPMFGLLVDPPHPRSPR